MIGASPTKMGASATGMEESPTPIATSPDVSGGPQIQSATIATPVGMAAILVAAAANQIGRGRQRDGGTRKGDGRPGYLEARSSHPDRHDRDLCGRGPDRAGSDRHRALEGRDLDRGGSDQAGNGCHRGGSGWEVDGGGFDPDWNAVITVWGGPSKAPAPPASTAGGRRTRRHPPAATREPRERGKTRSLETLSRVTSGALGRASIRWWAAFALGYESAALRALDFDFRSGGCLDRVDPAWLSR